jgi:hypothetical protein
MTMTTKRAQRTTPNPGTVTVHVVDPHLVYHDGEQRSGTLHDVPAETAEHWQRHGWVTVVDEPKTAAKPEDA